MRIFAALPLLGLLLSTACTAPPASSPATDSGAEREILAELQASAAAWNRGDLDGFMHPYAPDATFIGQDVVRGFDSIRDFYRGSWFRSGAPTVDLVYRDIEVKSLGPNSALVVGHWVVSDKQTRQETRHGIFSLTWMRTPAGWRMVHDHSS